MMARVERYMVSKDFFYFLTLLAPLKAKIMLSTFLLLWETRSFRIFLFLFKSCDSPKSFKSYFSLKKIAGGSLSILVKQFFA